MDKILVTLVVPSLGEKYDILIPCFLTVGETIILLTEAISEVTQSVYVSSGGEILCRKNPEMVLNAEYTLQEYGIVNGESLYLF